MSDIVLIAAWQNPKSREWIPIGKLKYEDNFYKFSYVKGVKKAKNDGFMPFYKMEDFSSIYITKSLFPQFANRLLAKGRPEYERYRKWLGLNENSTSLDELAKNNGVRVTDNMQLYALPKKQEKYVVEFFPHGMNYLIKSYEDRAKTFEIGEKLYLMQDLQNEYDTNALLIRTKDPIEIMGYVPRIYSKDFTKLLKHNATLTVKKVNSDSLKQFLLLCEFSAEWVDDFIPFSDEIFSDYKED